MRLSEVRAKKTKNVAVRVPAENLTEQRLAELRALLGRHQGDTPVALEVRMGGASAESETVIRLPDLRVKPTDTLLHEVNRLFGAPVAELRG